MKTILFVLKATLFVFYLLFANIFHAQNDYTWAFPLELIDDYYCIEMTITKNENMAVVDTISVALDTGSSNLMLLDSNCSTCNVNFIGVDKSLIGVQPRTPGITSPPYPFEQLFYMEYDEGQPIPANWWQSTITLHDATYQQPLDTQDYIYGIVSQDPESSDHKLPHIMGLGYNSNMTKTGNNRADTYLSPFLNEFLEQNNLSSIFSISMQYSSDLGTGDGRFDIGTPYYTPTIYMDVIGSTEYNIKPKRITFGDLSHSFNYISETIVDSGTTDLVVPRGWYQDFNTIFKETMESSNINTKYDPDNNRYWVNATHSEIISALQGMNVGINFNDSEYYLNSEYFFSYETDPLNNANGYISFNLIIGDDDSVILGQAFMKNFYIVFDRSVEPNRIGFYQLN